MGRNIPIELGQAIAAQMLGEWWNIAMTGLLHNTDLETAMKCMKPHTVYCGMEWWLKVKDSFPILEGVREGSLLQQALNIQIGNAHSRVKGRVELNDDEVVATVTDCWSAKFAYPFGWCASHEYFFEGNCKAINPDHSVTFTQRIADGHSSCKIIIKEKASPTIQNACGTSGCLPDIQFSDELINSNSVTLLSLLWMTTLDALNDAVGDKRAVEIIKPCMLKSGEAWGLKLGDMVEHKKGEEGVADLLSIFSQIMQLNGELFVNRERVDKVIDSCPFSSASETVCSLYDSFVEGLSRSADPGLVFVRNRISCSSSTFCHWKFEMMPKEGSRSDAITDSESGLTKGR